MKIANIVIWAVLSAAAFMLMSVFGIAKFICSRALQAAAAGVIAAVLWFAFVRKIGRKNVTK